MANGKRILLYGCGMCSKYYLSNYSFSGDCEVLGLIVSEKDQEQWNGYPVIEISEIASILFDEIWLTNGFVETLYNCLEMGVDKRKIVICNKALFDKASEDEEEIDYRYMKKMAEAFEEFATDFNKREIRVLTKALYLHERVEYTDNIAISDDILLHEDYFRFAMIKLLAAEIMRRNVQGAVAELGVYRGHIARIINMEFPDRKLFLFDTFDGMPKEDYMIDLQKNYLLGIEEGDYSNTSVEVVLNKMKYPETCVIRKGYFPDTIPEEKIEFAFVSIGVTLYKPTLDGVKFFYSNLSRGGYIVVNCYNSPGGWKGVKVAMREFEEEYPEAVLVPMADAFGSIIVCK